LSGEQGEGDAGDNWSVESDGAGTQFWERGKPVQLKHTVSRCKMSRTPRTVAPFLQIKRFVRLFFRISCDFCPLFALQSHTKVNTVRYINAIVFTQP
jgi:hypothetical protein